VSSSNPWVYKALVYFDMFTRDDICECGETSLGFPNDAFLEYVCVSYYS
jgi:hypothetical protein